MKEELESTSTSTAIRDQEEEHYKKTLTLVPVPPATDAEILAYLRRSGKLTEIAALAERDVIILTMCEQLGITISDAEWQAAGDAFRLERQLWGTSETLAWLKQQRIRIQEWSQGIRVALLEKKLKEHLFGATVDSTYISNQHNYRRVALSQILVFDLTTAEKIVQTLQAGSASFCALALEYSQGKLSQENGGFVGIRCLVELLPEIVTAITDAEEGEVIGPIKTKLGYQIFRVEKWLSSELNQSVREQILDMMFKAWLNNLQNYTGNGE
ncbi:parvulin-like peptidyl-prolyl isomerase [Cylindrospermum stagnale PCC 7417]|uniref:peptidylprolyl isomerase n=1 Tax=Cylindrospermum stagnale PCC 7417 TaxID=56107 RepID=K9X4H0_9NOST|nr:peptidylprolyl isomerase [Cylindrospermum stagnale]AFZ27368.1 parvulin-like peptidyl-prolyl isomerase [Cylindrospermum stagnale PCC 7417]